MLLICCGMPRSGSTLQFNAAWKVVEACGLGLRVDWRSPEAWANGQAELAEMAADPQLYVLKMHVPPEALKALAENSGRVRFVYSHRDLRDVIYSIKTKFGFSLGHAIKRVSHSLDAEEWLLTRPAGQVLIQDYSRLRHALEAAIDDLARFIGADLDRATIAALAAELSIDEAYARSHKKPVRFEHFARRINRLLGRNITFADPELMLHPNHVSDHRGRIGVGQEELSTADLAVIDKTFGVRVAGLADGR